MVSACSANKKTGPIPTVSRPKRTCPSECPFNRPEYAGICYADDPKGRQSIFSMVEDRQERPGILGIMDLVAEASRFAPAIRFNVSGDYFLDDEIDHEYIAQTNTLAKARPWIPISYTHGWQRLQPSMFDYVVRASCQTREELEAAHAAGWWTALADPGPDDPNTLITTPPTKVDGRPVIQCPKTTGKARSCAECRLCGREAAVIAFPIHGTKRRKGRELVNALREEQAA